MVNQQLLDYIKQQLQLGISREQVKSSLIANGWQPSDIDENFKVVGPIPETTSVINSSPIQATQPATSFADSMANQQDFINRWSWGAFLLNFLYFIASRNYGRGFLYLLGSVIPLLNIWLIIKSGLSGRKLVWESGKWQDFDSYQKRQKLLDKIGLTWFFVFLLAIIAILVAIMVFGYSAGLNIGKQVKDLPLDQKTSQALISPVATTTVSSNPDIDKVKVILADIRQGYLTGDKSLVIKHSSAATVAILSSGKIERASVFTVNSISPLESKIMANVTIVSAGTSEEQNMVFVKENNDWKFDLKATMEEGLSQSDAKKGTGNPNGLPDLVVTGITVNPSHPIVNSKNLHILVAIKNIGTKTSDGGSPLEATLLGFEDGNHIQGGPLYPITPGETVTWDFSPYDHNDFFKVSDTPGKKTVQIILNKDREIVESKYDNNIFTQTIQVFSN